jgi:hypothetical protein
MIAGLVLGAWAFAACGSADPGVQARQTGDTTTTTTTPESTTTTAGPPETTTPPTTTPATTTPPATGAAPEASCTREGLLAAYTAKYGALPAGTTFKGHKCVGGWATSSQSKDFGPPTFVLYRAEGDQWVALNRSAGKLCGGHGVPPEFAPQIGCDT